MSAQAVIMAVVAQSQALAQLMDFHQGYSSD